MVPKATDVRALDFDQPSDRVFVAKGFGFWRRPDANRGNRPHPSCVIDADLATTKKASWMLLGADARAGPRTEPASTRTLAEDNSDSEHALRLTYAIFLPFSASFQWPLDLPYSVSSLLWS